MITAPVCRASQDDLGWPVCLSMGKKGPELSASGTEHPAATAQRKVLPPLRTALPRPEPCQHEIGQGRVDEEASLCGHPQVPSPSCSPGTVQVMQIWCVGAVSNVGHGHKDGCPGSTQCDAAGTAPQLLPSTTCMGQAA